MVAASPKRTYLHGCLIGPLAISFCNIVGRGHLVNLKPLLTTDGIISVFALCLGGFGWGLMYLIAPAFGLLILVILTIKLLFKLNTWRKLPLNERQKIPELFRLMRNNPILSVKAEWFIQLVAFIATAILMKNVLLVA